jgi:alanyl-tRNA synthetase
MQYLIDNVRSKVDFDIVGELPQKNIDTGMGMERVAFLKQGVANMYEIDQVRPVLDRAGELSGRRYGANIDDDVRMRIIADHVRSALMLMTDGVVPANEGRGYVLRRLLRRSIRSMRLLGYHDPSFPELFAASRDAMSGSYPDVATEFSRVSQLANAEEESFLRTLEAGTSIVDMAVASGKTKGDTQLSGDTAFVLHDTYGFPIDLTLEMAAEAGLSVDRDAFDALMQQQRVRAKTDAKSKKTSRADLSLYTEFRALGETVFCGYDLLETESSVVGLLVDGISVDHAGVGSTVEVILAQTPLYAESGGQVSDSGVLEGPGFRAVVTDVQRPVPGLTSHTVTVVDGDISVGGSVRALVDPHTRYEGARAHSATHLIHAALRDTLGPHATQAGSLNRPGYMRLDFSWNQALSEDAQDAIGEIANSAIRDDLEVTTRILPVDEAKAAGAMALFGEKYGDVVRMVDIGGPWSRELCAGTHVNRSSQIGVITVVQETSVSSTARRIEALVGTAAVRDFSVEKAIMKRLTQMLKSPREDLPQRIDDLLGQVKKLERQLSKNAQAVAGALVPDLVKGAKVSGGVVRVVQEITESISADDLRSLTSQVLSQLGGAPAVVVLGAVAQSRGSVIVAANSSAIALGVHAGELVKLASTVMGGGGGGKPGLAQGGGPEATRLGAALEAIALELDKP